jgi:hypothetical protein
MSRPTYLDHSPQPDFIGALLDAPIFFRVQDQQHGLDLNSFNVRIENVLAISNGVYQSGFTGTITKENYVPNAISVLIYQTASFVYSQVVNVSAEINDLLGESGKDAYVFVTLPDPDIKAPIVTASPHGALFNSSFDVELICDDPVSTIYYTLNGTTPNLSSQIYTGPISITAEGKTTLKFVALDQNNNSSGVITEVYTIDSVAPISKATPPSGSFFTSQEVTLNCNDPQAIIYYTLNGLDPTETSPIYSTPIKIKDNKTTTIKFFAIDKAGNIEVFHTEVYSIEIAKNNYIPTNVFVTCPFNQSELHIRWDDMHPVYNQVIGYNIYRADVEMGPYQKLNSSLIGVTQYLDKTLDTQIVNEDVSEQFRRTVSISRDVNDSFNRSGPFDVMKWKEIDPAELLFQYGGAIFKDATGLHQTSKLVSAFKLRGDFQIRVKFELTEWISPDVGTQACQFIVKKDDLNKIEICRDKSHLVDVYHSHQYVNGNPEIPLTTLSSDVMGEFKIVRAGDIVTTYYYDSVSEDFIQIAAFDKYLEDLYVELSFKSEDKRTEMKFFDFFVDVGNPIIIEPISPRKEYIIYLSKRPVVDDTGANKSTDKSEFVDVTINGKKAYIRHLQGVEGLIELETEKMYDEVKKQWFEPPIPDEFSTVLVTYKVPLHSTSIRLRKNYFYKITCVTDEDETDIDLITPESLKPEKITYIYEEAVARNAWLLDQAGERVLLYIKRRAGTKCHCTYRDMKERTHKHPDQDCETCFGSGFVGGFDGPFTVIIAPLTTEQRVQQTDRGLKLAYQIETWLGPAPIVSQRDMIIRRNGDRCLVGPITPVEGPGGVMVQQHFVIEVLDSTDIRYKFPVNPLPNQKMQPGIDKSSKHVLNGGPNVATIDSPKEREELYTSEDRVSHQNDNVDHLVKGRSLTFESTEY